MEGKNKNIFSRPPRFLPEIPRGEVEIPAPPSNQDKPEIQWLSIFLPPLVMIAGSIFMAMNSGGTYVIITVATTVVTIFISLVNATNQIKKYKRYIKTRKTKYLQLISDLRTEFSLAKEQQIAGMNEINPSPSTCVERVLRTDSKLWEKTPAHNDFLSIRLGLGSIPATLQPKYRKAELMLEPDPLQEEPEKLAKEFEKISNLPVCLDLLNSEISGIAGPQNEVQEMLKVLALQMVTNHSYHDVKIVLLLKEEEVKAWEWMKHLPHLWDDDFNIRFMMCPGAMAHQTLGMLYDHLKERDNKQSNSEHMQYSYSQFVFIVSDSGLLEDEPISKYLYSGYKNIGVTTIFTAERKEYLPTNCKSVVTLQGKVGTYANKETTEQLAFNVDQVTKEDLEKVGRSLAPIRLKKSAANFSLPKSITLLETMKAKCVEEVPLLSNWSQNKTYNGMGVPIGARAGGELFNLDMQAYETSHGPHGLVAGTTGSGKSELLQSIIISLAINFHPHDVVFVLIDYKGGGMADVFKGMPHLVGTITNLGGNQTTRALLSIKSELKRRQAIFSAHEVNNIDKYQKLYHAGKAKEPLPHLIMIADEFAELKAEQPDFMKELVSAARVGRSLGVHLILATQKPAGVVDDQIWSNSRFKICLKVQDETDSKDVIKRPDAAMIKEPGRAYIQVGNDEIFEMFQSTFSGADYDPDGQSGKKRNNKKLFKVDLNGRSTQIYPLEQEHIDKSEKDSQLKAMVEYITKVAQDNDIEGLKGPWLPPLTEELYLDEVIDEIKTDAEMQKQVWASQEEGLVATVGIEDDPKGQIQAPLTLDFASEGNLMVYGSSGTGKTTFLESMMLSLAYRYSPEHFNLYIMDFGGGSLKKYSRLPHCGGVIGLEDEEKLNQFMRFIFRIIEERKEAFEDVMVSNIQAYNRESNVKKLPHIVLVIDNYFALSETYEEIDEKMLVLSREGSKYGIYVVATANSSTLVRYKMSINFKMAVTMQLTDETEYSNIVGRTEGLEPDKVLGRGLAKMQYPVEFQTALPQVAGHTTVEAIRYFESLQNVGAAVPIPQMPNRINLLRLNETASKDILHIGLNHNDMLPVSLDLRTSLGVMVAGDVQTGKSTTLISWTHALWDKFGKENVEMYIADSQNMGLFALTNESEYYDLTGYDIEEIVERLRNLVDERREELNSARQQGEDTEALYDSWKQVLIVIDNIIEFAEAGDYDLKETLMVILKKAYGLKILIIAAGDEAEYTNNWEDLVKGVREMQTGVLLGSIKEQNLFNARVPYGYYEKEFALGDGYLVVKNKFAPLKLGEI